MTFFCITDKESSIGFRLAGVNTREVSSRSDGLEALKAALATEEAGVLLVTEKAASFLRQELNNLMYKNQLPLILELPSRGGSAKRRSVGDYLKDIIGVSV
ncbi:MAG: V-type ATP synthase subunit F [Candidatus Omnitrophota bacterium]|nr:V-type ATP synthase subunit F [Candidatus Omnitrophota bacterium]